MAGLQRSGTLVGSGLYDFGRTPIHRKFCKTSKKSLCGDWIREMGNDQFHGGRLRFAGSDSRAEGAGLECVFSAEAHDLAGIFESGRPYSGDRAEFCDVSGAAVSASGLPSEMESVRAGLGVPVPRLPVPEGWEGAGQPGAEIVRFRFIKTNDLTTLFFL